MSRYILYFLGGTGLFLVSVALSCLLIGIVLVILPRTFFLDSHCRDWWVDQHRVVRLAGRLLKNAVGILLIVFGAFLSVPGVPGQGILTILVGLVLVDLPGKRKWERKLLALPRVASVVTRLRKRFGRPPFTLDELAQDPTAGRK